jgi:hypothetical protein
MIKSFSMSNYISATLSAADQQKIMNHLAEIRKILSFSINLTSAQKRSMPMLNDGRRPFAEKCMSYATNDPRIVPPYTDLEELKADLALYDVISPVEMEAASVAEMISNIRMAAGSDAYVASLSIYNSAKGAAKLGLPGTKAIADELSKLFDSQGKNTKPEVVTNN